MTFSLMKLARATRIELRWKVNNSNQKEQDIFVGGALHFYDIDRDAAFYNRDPSLRRKFLWELCTGDKNAFKEKYYSLETRRLTIPPGRNVETKNLTYRAYEYFDHLEDRLYIIEH